jgi:hypothetical protein
VGKKKGTILLLAGALVVSAVALPAAQATVSAGASYNCDHDNHCVEGHAWSSNGGVDIIRGVESGAAIAVCQGTGIGATLMEITCSLGEINGRGVEETMSFPGSAGAVPLVTTTNALERRPVCWKVTGIFPTILGSPHIVPTDDCALLAL